MFDEFRQYVKKITKERDMNYARIADAAGVSEGTVKCFMCGADNSRRVAERIADVLGIALVYSRGHYSVEI